MISVEKPSNLLVSFLTLWAGTLALGLLLKVVQIPLFGFLQGPMWDGILAIPYCILWIFVGSFWLVTWLWPVYLYGGWLLALLVVSQTYSKHQNQKEKTFESIIRYHSKKAFKTFQHELGFGKLELSGLLTVVHGANLANYSSKRIAYWVERGLIEAKPELIEWLGNIKLSFEYKEEGLPTLCIDGVSVPTH